MPHLHLKTSDHKVITVAADHELFGCLVISAQSRDINLKDVLNYKLSTLPYSLAQSDGSLRNTSKIVLLSELESMVNVQAKLPPPIQGMTTVHVIDVMAMVQMLQTGGASNFGELAAGHYDLIVAPLGRNGCIRVDVVFDSYTSKSIKAGERAKLGQSTALEIQIQGPPTPVPKQLSKYISNPQNKTNLCAFLAETWFSIMEEKLQMG